MLDTDPKTRPTHSERRKPEKELHDARASHACPAHRWVEKRRANRPERPTSRLPAHATA